MSACIEWTGCRTRQGYGRKNVGNHQIMLAHRWIWTKANGPIPKGMVICHRCDNPPCVNLDHLFIGTQSDNMLDAFAKNRKERMKGSRNGRSKLTFDQVQEIRSLSSVGEKQTLLAERFGVSQSLVTKIINYEVWSD